jgi:hypothetical protein
MRRAGVLYGVRKRRSCAARESSAARPSLPQSEVTRFAPDSPLEGGGFQLSVPPHGEVTAALR